MTTEALVRALAVVPAYHLVLLDLARELAGPDGIDEERAAERAGEVEAAIKEASAYSRAVEMLLRSINTLPAIPGGPA